MQQNNQNIIRMRKRLFLLLLAFISLCQMNAVERTKLNFNGGWLLKVGDFPRAEQANYKDAGWKQITLPRAFNEKEAFKVSIEHLSDTIMWYRKHFHIQEVGDRKYFIEFEGVRFGADIWLNGKKVGYTENGVMASGFDLTPYIIKGENVIAVRVDNSWNYRERTTVSVSSGTTRTSMPTMAVFQRMCSSTSPTNSTRLFRSTIISRPQVSISMAATMILQERR